MVRTSIKSKAKVVPITSGTAVDTTGYGKATIIVNNVTAVASITVTASATQSGTYANSNMVLPNGSENYTYTPAAVGAYVLSYIGSEPWLKITSGTPGNTTITLLLEEPVLSN